MAPHGKGFFSVTHRFAPKRIYHGWTGLFAFPYAIGHGGLRVIGGKPSPLLLPCPGTSQRHPDPL